MTQKIDINEITYNEIPISSIDVDPNNPRDLMVTPKDLIYGLSLEDPNFNYKKKEQEDLETLANSIKKQGLLNPIWVYKNNDSYCLIVGERRLLASILAGKVFITARIIPYQPLGHDLKIIQWIENVERSDLSLWERLRNIEMILDEHKNINKNDIVNATLIKKLVGCSLTHAVNYFTVLYSNNKLKEALQNNMINNLEKASLLASVSEDQEFFNELLNLTTKGMSLQSLKKKIRDKKYLAQSLHLISIKGKYAKKSNKINFGTTNNLCVIKTIIDIVLSSDDKYNKYSKYFIDIDWEDKTSVESAFKKFIKCIELEC